MRADNFRTFASQAEHQAPPSITGQRPSPLTHHQQLHRQADQHTTTHHQPTPIATRMTPAPTARHLSPRLEWEQPTLTGINGNTKPHIAQAPSRERPTNPIFRTQPISRQSLPEPRVCLRQISRDYKHLWCFLETNTWLVRLQTPLVFRRRTRISLHRITISTNTRWSVVIRRITNAKGVSLSRHYLPLVGGATPGLVRLRFVFLKNS